MKIGTLVGSLGLCGLAVFIGQLDAVALPGDGGDGGVAAGPDVIVGTMQNISAYGQGIWGGVTYVGYAVGTTSCNIGNQQLQWQANPSNLHPVIPQNMYRVKNGVLTQIGQSWVKHGFCALQGTLCGACTPAGSGCPSVLGIGCSDPYESSLNGGQSDLKSRSGINASTGYFSGTYSDPAIPTGYPSTIRERVTVPKDDLTAALNPGAAYFVECQYVHPADASNNNDNNNASYRRITVGTTYSTTSGYALSFSGGTVQQAPAMYAWQVIHADAAVREYDVVGDGRFLVGSRSFQNADGTWHYAYAVQNLNSDRNGGSFSVPLATGVVLTNIKYSAPFNHSGDVFTNTPWTSTVTAASITWSCEPNTNANAHAIRWSTTHTFEFDANSAPTDASQLLTLGIWKATTASSPEASISVLGRKPTAAAPPCVPADINCDGLVNASDLSAVLGCWGAACGDVNADGATDGQDLSTIFGAWTS
ncbi:MAG: hypothetical protein EXS03_05970 [Phycisphaerales bacterium]|nr:hypothetical protein [Phycisphaerales bacterium]